MRGKSFSGGTSITRTATSVEASAPMTLASCCVPSKRVTRTELPPWTTWRLVRIRPCLSSTSPDAVPVEVSSPKKPRPSASVVMLTTLLFAAA